MEDVPNKVRDVLGIIVDVNLQQVKQTMDLLTTKYLRALISYEGIQRIEKLPVPRESLREALLNSIVHKAYESLTPIQIAVYDNKLEIFNCGYLPEDWTMEKFLGSHRSRPYNPTIANVFFRAGEIETWGRGIERIINGCKDAGCPAPTFQCGSGEIWTVFNFSEEYIKGVCLKQGIQDSTTQKNIAGNHTDNHTEKHTENHTEKHTEKHTSLSRIQQEIIAQLRLNPAYSRRELASIIENASLGGVISALSRLQKLGVIRRVGPDKGGHWEIVEQ